MSDVMTAHCQSLSNPELVKLATSNLVYSQLRVAQSVARERGLHGFAHTDESVPEICLCGAAFVDGFHLDDVKRAHLAAVQS
jgi:hypothetical protein